jgi:hypothetical protein
MCVHSSDEVKHAIGEWQTRYRALLDFDTAHLKKTLVYHTGYHDTLIGVIDAVDLSICGDLG